MPTWYWRLRYRITGRCKRYIPGDDKEKTCIVCRWNRPPEP